MSTIPSGPPRRLVIASRESRLAMWQAEHVRDRLCALYPDCEVSILGMTTLGDRVLDRALNEIGGKGLFIKELEVALLEGRADLAVHSLKDVPMELASQFALPVIMQREDPRDAFVSSRFASLDALPAGARVGTSQSMPQGRCFQYSAAAWCVACCASIRVFCSVSSWAMQALCRSRSRLRYRATWRMRQRSHASLIA